MCNSRHLALIGRSLYGLLPTGIRDVMRTAVVVSIIGLIITSTAQGLASLTLGVALVGGSGAGIWMTAPVLAIEYVSERQRGLMIGALTSTIGVSNIASGLSATDGAAQATTTVCGTQSGGSRSGSPPSCSSGCSPLPPFRRPIRSRHAASTSASFERIPRWREVTIAYAIFGGMSAGFLTYIVAALEEHGGVAESTSPLIFSMMGIAG